MALSKWSEVSKNPAYLSLSDSDKGKAAQQYFNDVVVPQVGNDTDIQQAAKQFSGYSGYGITHQTKLTKQPSSSGVSAGDYGKAIMGGGASLVKGVGWLAKNLGAEDVGATLSDLGKDAADYWEVSDAAKEALSKKFITDNNEIGDAFNIDTIGLMFAGSLLPMSLGMGAGGVATKGLSAVVNPVTTKGSAIVGAVGYGAGETAITAPMAGSETYDEVMGMKHSDLIKHPLYSEVYTGMPKQLSEVERQDGAKKIIAHAAGRKAAAISGATTFISGAPAGAMMGRLSKGLPVGKSPLGSLAKGTLAEGSQEFVQEGAEAMAQNYAIQTTADKDRELMNDVANRAVGGATVGGSMGATVGLASHVAGNGTNNSGEGSNIQTDALVDSPISAIEEKTDLDAQIDKAVEEVSREQMGQQALEAPISISRVRDDGVIVGGTEADIKQGDALKFQIESLIQIAQSEEPAPVRQHAIEQVKQNALGGATVVGQQVSQDGIVTPLTDIQAYENQQNAQQLQREQQLNDTSAENAIHGRSEPWNVEQGNLTQEDINVADSVTPKVPEKPETVALQLQDMLNPNTPREALLVTEGEAPVDVPDGYSSVDVPGKGTLIYGDPSILVKFMQGEDVLGYGTSEKPADTAHLTTTVRDESGAVKQDVIGTNEQINNAAEAVAGDTGTIEVRPTEEAIAERQDGVEHVLPNDASMLQQEVISETPQEPDISPPLISETTNQPDLAASNTEAVSVSAPKELKYDIQKTGSVIVSGDNAREALKQVGITFIPRKDNTALVGKKNAAKAIKLIKSQSPEALNRKALRSQKAAENARKRKEISSSDSLELFVRKVGGVSDGDFIRSFSAKEIGKTGNNFYGSLAHKNGNDADYIAELAQEAGYIQERTPQALYDALDLEVRQGVKQYATGHEIDLAEQHQRDLEAQDKLDEALLNEYGETLESVYEHVNNLEDAEALYDGLIYIDDEVYQTSPISLDTALENNYEYDNSQGEAGQETNGRRYSESQASSGQNRHGSKTTQRRDLPTEETGQQKLLDTGKPQVSSEPIKLDDKQNKPLDLKDENSLFGAKERAEAKGKQPDLLTTKESSPVVKDSLTTEATHDDTAKNATDRYQSIKEAAYKVASKLFGNDIYSKSIQNDWQNLLDAIDNKNIEGLRKLAVKYKKDEGLAGLGAGASGAGPKKVNQARNGAAQIARFARESSENLEKETLYSRKTKESVGVLTDVELDTVIERVINRVAVKVGVAGNATRHPVVIVDSFSDLPSAVTKHADNEGHGGDDVDGLFHKGKVYLIKDNVARHSDVEANVEKVLLHEFVHADMRSMFGKNIHQAMNNLWLSIGGNKGIREIAKARGIDLSEYAKAGATANYGKEQRQAIMMDELLAHIGQEKPKLKDKVKRIIGMIRQWLRDKGLLKLAKYSETDLLNLISTARKQVTQAKGGDTRFMVAWHGSPHDHDGFKTDNIGTGEGNQAYGYGLYFAGNKKVAEWYRKSLTGTSKYDSMKIDGEPFMLFFAHNYTESDIATDALVKVFNADGDINKAIAILKGKAENSPVKGIRSKSLKELGFLEGFKVKHSIEYDNKGKLYQVKLAPKEDEHLLWDKPLSEQSNRFKDAIDKLAYEHGIDIVDSPTHRGLEGKEREDAIQEIVKYADGADIYGHLEDTLGSDKAASEHLHSLGIRGIKYLDGSNRQVANYRISPPEEVKAGDWMVKGSDPTAKGVHFKTEAEAKAYIKEQEGNASNYNYVIFNDEDVSIIAKYSRSKTNTSGLTVNDAKQSLIKKFGNRVKRSIEAGDTVIVRTESGLPDYAKNSVAQNTESFAKDVDAFVDGTLKGSDYLHLGETPQSLTLSGGKDLPITMSQKVADKVINSKHLLSKDAIKQIPSAIADPVMVFDSATQSNSLVVMTELTDKGKTIVVAIKLNVENQRLEVNAISSIYSKDNSNVFASWVNKGLLAYANKEKSRKWFKTRGLQLPKVLNQSDFKAKYKTEKDLVQPKYSDGGNIQGAFDPVTKKTYIVANNNTEASLPSVLLHEAGHAFFASEKGKAAKNKAITNIIKADSLARNGKGKVAEWVREAKDVIPKDTPPEAYYEEILAYAIQQYSEVQNNMPVTIKGIVKRLLDALRAFAMKHTKLIFKADPALLTELAKQYIGTQSHGKGSMLETGVQYSKQFSDYIVQALKMLGKGEKDLFQYPGSKAKGFDKIVDDIALNGDMTAVEDTSTQNVDKSWKVTMKATVKGEDATASAGVYQNGKYVWINAISLKEGVSGGSRLYHAVATYAHNNGLVFRGDPAGLKPVAHYRRLENMLSSALRFGTTDHIQPHAKQLKGLNEGGWKLSPLKWVTGDTDANIQAMLDLSAEYVYAAIPAIKDIGFDFETGVFYDKKNEAIERTDTVITEERWVRYARSQRARKNGIGSTTLKRIVFWNALRGQKHDSMAKLSRFTHLSGLGEADRIFYSKQSEEELKAEQQVKEDVETFTDKVKNHPVGKVANAIAGYMYYRPVQRIRDLGTPTASKISDLIYKEERNEKRAVKDFDFIQRRQQKTGEFMQRVENLLNNIPGKTRKERKLNQAKVIAGMNGEQVPKSLYDITSDFKDLFDDMYIYQTGSGLEIGRLDKYYPRVYDVAKLTNSGTKKAFVKMLDEAKYNGEQVWRNIVENDGLFHIHDGSDRFEIDEQGNEVKKTSSEFYAGRFQHEGGIKKQSYEKNRTIDVEFSKLEPFLINELDSVMARHIHGVTTRAEYSRIFGKNEGELNKMVKQFAKEYSDLPSHKKQKTLQQAIGDIYWQADRLQGRPVSTGWVEADRGIQHAKNFSVMTHLGLVLLASISETLAPAIRGGIGTFSKQMWKGINDGIVETAASIEKVATGKRTISKTEWREQAELFGVVSQHAIESVMHQRFGSSTSKFTSIFMRVTMLEQLTNIQRIIAFNMAQANIKSYAKKLSSGAKGRSKMQMVMELRDFGVSSKEAVEWYNEGSDESSKFWHKALMGSQRFSQQVITSPNEATLPKVMRNPIWSMVFQFKSFISVYSNTFVKGVLQNSLRGKTLESKLRPVLPMVLMVGIAFFVQFLREYVKYGEDDEDILRESEDMKRWYDAFDRAGFTGDLSTLYMWFNPYRYGYTDQTAIKGFNLMGPLVGDAARITDAIGSGDPAKIAKTIAKMTPGVNAIFPLREAWQEAIEEAID